MSVATEKDGNLMGFRQEQRGKDVRRLLSYEIYFV